jgi:hypothetical protein
MSGNANDEAQARQLMKMLSSMRRGRRPVVWPLHLPHLHHVELWNGAVLVHDDEGEIARGASIVVMRTRWGCAALRDRLSVRWYRTAPAPVR